MSAPYPPANHAYQPGMPQPPYPPTSSPGYGPGGGQAQPPSIGFQVPPPYTPPSNGPGGYPPPMPGGEPGAPPAAITAYPPPALSPNVAQYPPPVPPGLEYLTMIDQLLVKQKLELIEALIGFETNNKYSVKNIVGQNVFYAIEENNCCTRICFGANRPFQMTIVDNQRNEVMRINRPFRCSSCFCPCFLQEIEVTSRSGQLLGIVRQNWSLLFPNFSILDNTHTEVLKIEGPFFTCSICGDAEFKVLTLNDDPPVRVGKISKQWSGLAREFFTDSDYFGVTFPMDLDVNIKAVLLAATFLIDYMYFESTGGQNSQITQALS